MQTPQMAMRVCLLAVMVDYIGVSMMRTLLPYRAASLGMSNTMIGALESTYGVGQVVGALFLGKISDRHGRIPVLIISFVGSIIGYSVRPPLDDACQGEKTCCMPHAT